MPVLLQQLIADRERRNDDGQSSSSIGKPDAAQRYRPLLIEAAT